SPGGFGAPVGGPARPPEPQLLGALLVPVERSLGSIESNPEAVLRTRRDLRGDERPERAAVEPEQDAAVVVDRPPVAAAERGARRLDAVTGEMHRQIAPVGPEVGE